jgi:2-aminoadipate transaminase
MQVEVLAEVVERAARDTGRRPKLIYTVPDFSNPSGACMSVERRRRLVQLADGLCIPVLEDDPYGRLRFSGERLPNLKRLAGDSPTVVYASSFSKVLAPGVRVAWTVASPELVRSMVLMRQGEDLCTSTVTQALVAEYCRRGLLEDHLGTIIATYARKSKAMHEALVRHLPTAAADWQEPRGGFFFWLRLAHLGSQDLFTRAVDSGIAFVPGPAFYPAANEQTGEVHGGERFARLCFTFADEASIDTGCRRLGAAMAD